MKERKKIEKKMRQEYNESKFATQKGIPGILSMLAERYVNQKGLTALEICRELGMNSKTRKAAIDELKKTNIIRTEKINNKEEYFLVEDKSGWARRLAYSFHAIIQLRDALSKKTKLNVEDEILTKQVDDKFLHLDLVKKGNGHKGHFDFDSIIKPGLFIESKKLTRENGKIICNYSPEQQMFAREEVAKGNKCYVAGPCDRKKSFYVLKLDNGIFNEHTEVWRGKIEDNEIMEEWGNKNEFRGN